ncbi:MAG: hypothetical protein LBH05_02265 [Deferribacteraceae bacterium]|jgi:hypothetical protein|nr:hypothetical protein [Deferribacteraceae bacterium]
MEKEDVAKQVELLIKDICVKGVFYYTDERLERYTLQELKEMAVHLYLDHGEYPEKKANRLLKNILETRAGKMDQGFTWSKDNKTRFLEVNNKLTQAFEVAYNEALTLRNNFEDKIENKDPFLKDYEMEIIVQPFIKEDSDDDCFPEVLACSEYYNCIPIVHSMGHSFRRWDELPEYLSKEINYNGEYFGGEFDTEYIGYSIHALLDTHIWSFEDILNIETVCTDIKIYYQNRTDI